MLERFSTSLDQDLLAEFDAYIQRRQYRNRSEAIRDMIRDQLVREQWAGEGEVVGILSLVFDHHQYKLQDRLTEHQHDHHDLVIASTHIHLDHNNCLEVVILRGNAGDVRDMAEGMKAMRGVKNAELSMSTTGRDMP